MSNKFKVAIMTPPSMPDYYCVTFIDKYKTKHHFGCFEARVDAVNLQGMLILAYNLAIEEKTNEE